MALQTIIGDAQTRVKDSYASSPVVGLAVRANGEEKVQVIDSRGNVYNAGFDSPTVAPTIVDGGSGALTPGQWYAYVYVYASSKFPFVQSDNSVNGKLFPYSLPSPLGDFEVNNGQNSVTVTKTTAAGIDTIWVFRTSSFGTQIEADTAAQAGQVFFSAELVNDGTAGTVNYVDNNPVDSIDQVDLDNYEAPQFQLVVYYDPYWWGFGNFPFVATSTWDNTNSGSTGLVTITAPDKWYNGRNGQNISFDGITTGGFDGNGTFKFLWLAATTGTVTLDGTTPVALPGTGNGKVTIQGPATTLYRSKPRNPFAWGWTEVVGSVNVPQQYAFKVGGGMGTCIATVPNSATLKLDCEYPAKCFTLNLRAAGTDSFEPTLRIISDVYSVSAPFTSFAATTQNGQTVLWGLDYKNFAILQSDGVSQVPISTPIPKILRMLTQDRTRQLLAHGVYDPKTELNCIWVSTFNSLSLVNYLIYQHAPTGFWGFVAENDILSSAAIQDTLTGEIKTFVGTQSGFLGQALVEGVYNNWLPDTGAFLGVLTAATGTTVTTTDTFNTADDGIVGNWVLITDPNDQQEQLGRVSAVTANTLTFDVIRSLVGGGNAAFNPVPAAGWKYYIGLIECRLLKYFDFQAPQTDKQLMELWCTQMGVDPNSAGTLIRWYRERENTYIQVALLQNMYGPNSDQPSDSWYVNEEIPSELVKMFGLEIINRGYQQWRFVNMILKPRMTP